MFEPLSQTLPEWLLVTVIVIVGLAASFAIVEFLSYCLRVGNKRDRSE